MILRNCVCIPTYNNPETIVKVIEEVLTHTVFPVLVIDDGSIIPVETLVRAQGGIVLEGLVSERVKIIRHPENKGKGIALQTAFQFAVSKGYTHLMAMDGDGQHLVSEVPKLIQAMLRHPWDLILGNRKMVGETVPQVSKFGRAFSNFWVKYQTKQKVADSQSGFRVYPLFHVQNLRFYTKKFDFEIEVLIRLLWKGVTIREVDIDVFYPPPEERISHFHKLWDNVRISLLNTLLVVLSLLRSPQSSFESALAVALGVWVGCTPLYGLHTFIVAGLSFLSKLNFVFMVIGTQVSFPPFMPFLLYASVEIGKFLGVSWVWGSLVVATVLALIAGLATFAVMETLKKKSGKKKSWSGKSRGGKFGNWFLKTVAQRLGLGAAYFCLYFVIPYFYCFAPTARKSANEYWKIIDPQLGFFTRQFRVMKQLHQFGRVLLDRIYQNHHSEERFKLASEGGQNILDALSLKSGLILLGGHVGGWDLAARSLKRHGFQGNLTLIQYEASGVTFNKLKDQNDSDRLKLLAVNEVQSQGSQPVFSIRDSLAQGMPIGFMGDRPIGTHDELVLFFGKLAPMDTTAFRIATACQAPVIFTFGFKGKGDAYEFYASRPQRITVSPGPNAGKEKVALAQKALQQFATELEFQVRRHPEQWFNFYPFWSTPPSAPEDVSAGIARHSLIEDLIF